MVDDPHDHQDRRTAATAPASLITEERIKAAQRYWWILLSVGTVAAAIASTATQFANYAARSEQTAADLAITRQTSAQNAARTDLLAQAVRDLTAQQGAAADHFARIESVLGSLTIVNDKQRDELAQARELAAAERERLGFVFDRLAPPGTTRPAAVRKW